MELTRSGGENYLRASTLCEVCSCTALSECTLAECWLRDDKQQTRNEQLAVLSERTGIEKDDGLEADELGVVEAELAHGAHELVDDAVRHAVDVRLGLLAERHHAAVSEDEHPRQVHRAPRHTYTHTCIRSTRTVQHSHRLSC